MKKILTHLQVAVLSNLDSKVWTKGQDLRDRLKADEIRKSGPAFYQMMARLENKKLIEGNYIERVVDGQRLNERHYKIMPRGSQYLNETFDFFEHFANLWNS